MSDEPQPNQPVQQLRNNKNIEFLEELITDIQESDKEIDIPERDSLFTDNIFLENEPDGNICINGQWVHPVMARIVNQINDGLAPNIAVVGKEGYGKSMTGLWIAYLLHNKLNVLRNDLNLDNQLVYRPLEFLFLERESTRTAELFEEANETLNVNDYHTVFNKSVAGAVRTQRKRENPKIFIGPELQQIDSRIRDKLDVVVEMKGKRYAEVTTYKLKHAKKSNRGMDYYFNNDYPDWKVPKVPESYKESYDKIDNNYKGSYLDDLILEVLQEKINEMEKESTATI